MTPAAIYCLIGAVVFTLAACRAGLKLSWVTTVCMAMIVTGSAIIITLTFDAPHP